MTQYFRSRRPPGGALRRHIQTSRLHPRHVVPKPRQPEETKALVQVREWKAPALASSDVVLDAQPPAQPYGGVVVERPVRLIDGTYLEVARPSRPRNARFNLPTSSAVS